MRKVAAVFGGTGFIGRQVVQRLAREDYVVRVCARRPPTSAQLYTMGRVAQVATLAADVTDDAAVARAVAGAEIVVNTVGILHGDFQRIQAEGPARIGRHAAAAGVARVVHLSAIGADRQSASAYARTKAEGEEGLLAAFPRATIIRPSIVFGEGDGFFGRFGPMAAWLPVMPVIKGQTRFQPVHVGDVADAVLACLRDPATEGRIFEVAGPRVWTFRELLAFTLKETGRDKRLVAIPDGLARMQAWLGEFLPNPPLTRDQLLLLDRDNVASADMPGLKELGLTPKAVEAVMPRLLSRFRSGGGRRIRDN
ncbi:complex I NDUFA9 subunit family protein [Sabulicella glaciei]|uniref:Complex I NDUFA9 subunit family protein n=1 Tax=Sabulicella glaciei TaxID=2984948 RepID=A0ABT3NQQ1_9PROT|nr:complex I NDUFA9 subunit family protein [Roseococcus sp. MDT2-1-1]MCW8084485.1 complex I NDUFA9 subunit family protein [Roseococcus sp. MDT2-1-1]